MKQPDILLLHGALGAKAQFQKLQPLMDGFTTVHCAGI